MLINGYLVHPFRPSRGSRQGDHLSPFLFLICVKGLSGLLNMGIVNQSFSGFKINIYCPMISHLMFVDDCLLFFNASISNVKAIKDILDSYSRAFRPDY